MSPAPRAIVLLSGGMDSATCLGLARQAGFASYALSFRYGQRHEIARQLDTRPCRRLAYRAPKECAAE